MMLLFRNATLYDGSGNAPARGNLLVNGGQIAAVGNFSFPGGVRQIDLHGLALAPGFIDLHSHSDLKTIDRDTAKTVQGVTTELVGNCGFSAFPHCSHADEVGQYNEGILCDTRSYSSATDFLSHARVTGALAHVETLVGYGTLRTAASQRYPHKKGAALIAILSELLDEALHEGAAGLSSGLMYAPGATAPKEELEALCAVVARHNKLYATHMRSYSWQLLEAVDEQLALARHSGCRLQISHMQAVGAANWSKQCVAIERIEEAHAKGIDVEFDSYPYLAGSTVLSQLLPQQLWVEGIRTYWQEVQTEEHRQALLNWLDANTAQRWSDIRASSHPPLASGRSLVGLSIEEEALSRNLRPTEVVLDWIEATDGKIQIVAFNQSEENLRALLMHPLCSVISDGLYTEGIPHPRLYGSFAHFLGHYTRECGWLSLEAAIRKITAQPASRLRMRDRGCLQIEYRADLVVFDPATVGSPANYNHPRQGPTGVVAVYRQGQQIEPAVHPAGR
jgi:N-acyl-D-aspartate/D-glutamate deacylase